MCQDISEKKNPPHTYSLKLLWKLIKILKFPIEIYARKCQVDLAIRTGSRFFWLKNFKILDILLQITLTNNKAAAMMPLHLCVKVNSITQLF